MITFFYWWTVLSVITTCIAIYSTIYEEGWEKLYAEMGLSDTVSLETFKSIYIIVGLLIGFFLFPIMFAALLLKIARYMK